LKYRRRDPTRSLRKASGTEAMSVYSSETRPLEAR
jgi:hypothetical protein